MYSYTTERENKIYEIYPESDGEDGDYIEALLEVAKGFRSFGQAMDTFLASQGYKGDVKNRSEKTAFLTLKFKEAGMKAPRSIKRWLTEPADKNDYVIADGSSEGPGEQSAEGAARRFGKIERKTAYQICFAFKLGVEETEDFFRRIYLERGFDRHNREEVIYYYALDHGLSYEEAQRMIQQLSEGKEAENQETESKVKENKEKNKGMRYTASIIEETEKLTNAEELVTFLKAHKEDFAYHNVTACGYIRDIWREIAFEEGLAAREKKKLYRQFDTEPAAAGGMYGKKTDGTQCIREEKPKQSGADSLWEIYLQILGLTGINRAELGTDRSIKPVLRDNDLLHPLAEDCFPDRDGLNKVLNGEKVSYERIRKLIILLAFYRFWVRRALKYGNYQAQYGDRESCISNINDFLTDAGYPALYPGNPFDWLILFSSADDYPLRVFREYMQELYFRKETVRR